MDINQLLAHVTHSILQAEAHNSKLSPEILNMYGQSSPKIRHLLNNIGEFPDINYLEIGLGQGSTFVSSLYKNSFNSAYAVEIELQPQFKEMCNRFQITNYKLFQSDCFTLDLSLFNNKINVYLYDGDHSYGAQYNAIKYYYPILDDTFVLLVDDFDWTDTNKPTYQVIKDLDLKVIYEQHFHSTGLNDATTWWNGFYVAILKK